jgi:formate dehydrogenase maturation protein FdhE
MKKTSNTKLSKHAKKVLLDMLKSDSNERLAIAKALCLIALEYNGDEDLDQHIVVKADQLKDYAQEFINKVDTEPQTAKLMKLANKLKIKEGDLDVCIHDLFSEEASNVNNGGTESQVFYLVQKIGYDAAKRLIEERWQS